MTPESPAQQEYRRRQRRELIEAVVAVGGVAFIIWFLTIIPAVWASRLLWLGLGFMLGVAFVVTRDKR